tara:strand:+ start:1135 stop:1284 length:150 start_codon:yes stop_codon:yes gene_type:complete
MAGAQNTGHLEDKKVASKTLSHIPFAILDIVFADAGEIRNKSGQRAKST